MSHYPGGSDATSFSRDTGPPSEDGPKLDPFAALRHLNIARATTSRITPPFSIAPSPSDSSPLASSPALTSIGAERRPLGVGDEKLVDAPPPKKAKISNTILVGDRLQTFLDMAPVAQRAMLAREEGPPRTIKCPRPHKPPPHPEQLSEDEALFHCFDCYHAPIVCKDCLIRDHVRNPFHRIETWTDAAGFWERTSLGQINGFVLNLGHAGEVCTSHSKSRVMTIVHEHGVIEMEVRFCVCLPEGERFTVREPIQLLRFGLFPGTWKKPMTAFTINGLRDYHLLSLQCQITGIDFAVYLQRSTDSVLSHEVTDRHRELNESMRQFMFLRSTRRARQEPKIGLDTGSLAVLCPTCPQPHKNMDPDRHLEDEDSYLDMLFYTIDGNFQAAQKFKPMDMTDFPLTTGGAYYAHERDYEVYRNNLPPRRKEPTTCCKFGAMGYSRYKGRVSGVVGLSCARHMFVFPCGTVDILGSEGFAYADYCMCAGLRLYVCLKRHHRGYDINCQYTIYLPDRLRAIHEKHHNLPTIQAIYFPWTMVGIGKFHVAAHQESCRSRYSYYYLPGSGMTDGEAPERIWASLNNLSMRTKEMSSGHRHDVINDYYGDLNVRRVHNMHNTLANRMERAKIESTRTREYLTELEENIPATNLAEWCVEEEKWKENVEHLERDGANFESPYELKKHQGISPKELLASLVKKSGLTGESAVSLLGVLERGVELQQEREALLDVLAKDNRGALRDVSLRCETFFAEIERWQALQDVYLTPLVEDATASARTTMQPAPEHDASSGDNPRALQSESPFSLALRSQFLFRDVSADFRESGDGLPRQCHAHGKLDSWKEVFDVSIHLPSSYHATIRAQPSMHRVCELEYDFRRVAANEALGDLRATIISREVVKMKRKNSHSKKTTERYDRRIGTANAEVDNLADHYRRHWSALRILGMKESDPHFRCLKDTDAVNVKLSTAQNLLGQSKEAVSWIWGDFSFVEHETDSQYQEFYDDARRVHWFRSSAVCARWKEEVRLLEEEMYRTLRFHVYMRDQWNDHARTKDAIGDVAAAAYARKQARRYDRLINACTKRFGQYIKLDEPSLRDALADIQ